MGRWLDREGSGTGLLCMGDAGPQSILSILSCPFPQKFLQFIRHQFLYRTPWDLIGIPSVFVHQSLIETFFVSIWVLNSLQGGVSRVLDGFWIG